MQLGDSIGCVCVCVIKLNKTLKIIYDNTIYPNIFKYE